MNDRQNAKLNMAQRVADTLKRYGTAYAGIPLMTAAVADLNTAIADIRHTQQQRGSVNVPASTLEKRTAETRMIEPCVKMANALYVIGFNTDNQELITLTGLSENSFYSLSDNAALALARRILDLARQYAAELQACNIEQQEIDETGQAVEAFHELIAKPMDTIGARKQKTTNLAQLFAGMDSIFYDRLDKLMVLFKKSNPDFYGEYRTARNLII